MKQVNTIVRNILQVIKLLGVFLFNIVSIILFPIVYPIKKTITKIEKELDEVGGTYDFDIDSVDSSDEDDQLFI